MVTTLDQTGHSPIDSVETHLKKDAMREARQMRDDARDWNQWAYVTIIEQ